MKTRAPRVAEAGDRAGPSRSGRANAARLTRATSSRQATSRGQRAAGDDLAPRAVERRLTAAVSRGWSCASSPAMQPLDDRLEVARVLRPAVAQLPRGELDDRADERDGVVGRRRAGACRTRSCARRVLARRSARRTAAMIASRRSIARGPAPMISTSSVCASAGKSASAPRNASHARADAAPRARRPRRPSPARSRCSMTVGGRVEQREDALLLVGEVLVERRLRHPGLAADRLGAGLGVAAGGRRPRPRPRTGGRAGGRRAPRAAARGVRAGGTA